MPSCSFSSCLCPAAQAEVGQGLVSSNLIQLLVLQAEPVTTTPVPYRCPIELEDRLNCVKCLSVGLQECMGSLLDMPDHETNWTVQTCHHGAGNRWHEGFCVAFAPWR